MLPRCCCLRATQAAADVRGHFFCGPYTSAAAAGDLLRERLREGLRDPALRLRDGLREGLREPALRLRLLLRLADGERALTGLLQWGRCLSVSCLAAGAQH
jgi:hypothetical protein